MVREKSGKCKVRKKWGNFRICQGKLEFCWKSGKFKKIQGNLWKFLFHKRLRWSISISKNFQLAPSALASYFSTHFILDVLFETYTDMYIMIYKVYNHTNTYMSQFLYVSLVREKWKSQGILISCVSGNPVYIKPYEVTYDNNSDSVFW